jgi:hypothetical protein
MGQDVGGRPAFFSGAERGEAGWRIAQRLSRTVGQRGQSVPQKLPAGSITDCDVWVAICAPSSEKNQLCI